MRNARATGPFLWIVAPILGWTMLATPAVANTPAPTLQFQVNSTVSGHQSQAGVDAYSDGSFLVVWLDGGDDGYAQRFNADGTPSGSEILLVPNPGTTMDSATTLDGGFVVAGRLSADLFDANNAPVGDSLDISMGNFPAIAVDQSGNFVIVWKGPDSNGYDDIFGRKFDTGGSPIGSAFQVNTYTTEVQSGPDVATFAEALSH